VVSLIAPDEADAVDMNKNKLNTDHCSLTTDFGAGAGLPAPLVATGSKAMKGIQDFYGEGKI
jgi:hypothetical protein